jgi:hypothetical protein
MRKNVQCYFDKHVVKMILEHAQILSTVCHLQGLETEYKPTHPNHPCTKWARESWDNYRYLYNLTVHLHDEWLYRYEHPVGKLHKSYAAILKLDKPDLPDIGLTRFALAMPDEYKQDDAVQAYRDYYKGQKQHLASWKKRPVPEWWN